ncbi:MAG: FtsW/RodA/SpoVE family cell cycle protein, partial [Lachnospiraceae bacterium]|nr:FtsW/RodA/SpoVE family cell cycle protein [Lachnospiraceae bacterium]
FLFVLLLWRIFIIAINAPDLFGSLIATGVMAHIAVQVLINVAVVTNTIPSTGIPLPFISYGGSSLLVLMMEMGIVLSVSDRIEGEQ